MHSLLIGCRELKILCAFNAIVEGDSRLALLGRSSHGDYPWHLADWVEETRSLSTYLNISFQHVLCESNSLADALAKDGASHTEFAFDVRFVSSFVTKYFHHFSKKEMVSYYGFAYIVVVQ